MPHALEEFKKTENDGHVFRYSPYCWRFKPNYLPAFPVAAQSLISSTVTSQREDPQVCILYLRSLRESAPLFLSPACLVYSCSSVCLEQDGSCFLSRPPLLHVLSPVCGKEEPPHSQSLSRPQTPDLLFCVCLISCFCLVSCNCPSLSFPRRRAERQPSLLVPVDSLLTELLPLISPRPTNGPTCPLRSSPSVMVSVFCSVLPRWLQEAGRTPLTCPSWSFTT